MVESEKVGNLMLHDAKFGFSQDGNTEGTTSEVEELVVECEAISFADDGVSDQQCFFVLKTEGWSVNDASDIEKITNALNEGIKVIKEKLK